MQDPTARNNKGSVKPVSSTVSLDSCNIQHNGQSCLRFLEAEIKIWFTEYQRTEPMSVPTLFPQGLVQSQYLEYVCW